MKVLIVDVPYMRAQVQDIKGVEDDFGLLPFVRPGDSIEATQKEFTTEIWCNGCFTYAVFNSDKGDDTPLKDFDKIVK
jgi:hypothetical protein